MLKLTMIVTTDGSVKLRRITYFINVPLSRLSVIAKAKPKLGANEVLPPKLSTSVPMPTMTSSHDSGELLVTDWRLAIRSAISQIKPPQNRRNAGVLCMAWVDRPFGSRVLSEETPTMIVCTGAASSLFHFDIDLVDSLSKRYVAARLA